MQTWRTWLAVAGVAACVLTARAADERQVAELRTYTFASEAKLAAFGEFLAKAHVPAWNRAGVKPVGVFRLMKADNAKLNVEADGLDLYVLLAHPDAAAALTLAERLAADAELQAAAKAVQGGNPKDPAYTRFAAQMLLGFAQHPRVTAPSTSADRVIQMRIYESANDERALKKIAMFNEGGEIALFKRLGLNPVCFGQSVAGTALPNLTYILGFDSPAAMDAAWAAFMKDPEWAKLKGDPQYADTVSKITNLVLRPVFGSQI